MTITDEGIQNLWRAHVGARYNKLERARPWALNDDARRLIVFLWQSCSELDPENAGKLFESSLEQLADECGINVLQSQPPAEIKAPEMWRDLWGNPLPNPFLNKDVKGQLVQRDPTLATWLKKFAADPYGAAAEWQDEQAANLKTRAAKYDENAHRVNPYVSGFTSETERGKFEKEHRDLVEQCKREAVPVGFPTGGNFNLTVQSRIARTPKLAALAAGMRRHEQQFIAEARAKAKAEIEAAKKNLESLEAAATILRDEIPLRYTLCRPHGLRDDSDYKPYRNQGRPIGRLEPT